MRMKLSAVALIVALDQIVAREAQGTSPINNPRGLLSNVSRRDLPSAWHAPSKRINSRPYL